VRVPAFIVAVATMSSMANTAVSPVRLGPSTPWVLDYAENSCRLSRAFGDHQSHTVLLFESTAPGEMSLVAVGKPLATFLTAVPAKFAPVQSKPITGSPERTTDGEPGVLWSGLTLLPDALLERVAKSAEQRKARPGVRPPPIDVGERDAERAARQAFASSSNELEIDVRRGRPVILETGPLGEPIKMFDECSRESLRDWGVDPDLNDKIVRPVWAPDPSRWFSSADYPEAMVVRLRESEVRVRLLVDAAGRVTKCTSLSHFDEPEFNRITCDKFVKRARFEPAELADGTKVPSYYVIKVNFRIR
jgi:TonB family protein